MRPNKKKRLDTSESLTLNIGADKLSRIARHFAKAHGVDVRFVNAAGPSTEGKTIFLPEDCKNWSNDPILFNVLRGYLDRELWRIREAEIAKERRENKQEVEPSHYILDRLFKPEEINQGFIETPAGNVPIITKPSLSKSAGELMSYMTQGGGKAAYPDVLSMLSVSWEELRIQRSASRTYIGMRANIAKMHEYLHESIKKMREEQPEAVLRNFFLDICNAPLLIENDFIKDEWESLSEEAQKWIDAYMPELMDAADKMLTPEDMFNITVGMLQRIVEEVPPQPPNSPQNGEGDSSEEDSEDGEENGEGSGGLSEDGEEQEDSSSGASGDEDDESNEDSDGSDDSDESEGEGDSDEGTDSDENSDGNSDDSNESNSNENSESGSNSDGDSEKQDDQQSDPSDKSKNENGGWCNLKDLNNSLKELRDEMRDTKQMQGMNRATGNLLEEGKIPEIPESRAQIFEGNYNPIPNRVKGAIPGAPKSILDGDCIENITQPRKDVLERINRNVNYTARTLSRKLKNIIRVMAQNETEYDKRVGELDDDALADIISGKKNVFMETTPGRNHNNIAWLFLVDMSGSMGGFKEVLAIEACMTVAQAIADAGNDNFCIAGFDNPGARYGSYRTKEHGKDLNFGQYVRQESMRIQLVKKFSDPWRKVKNNVTGMKAGFNNADGDAIRWAAARLLEVDDVARRELVVFSDGHPSAATHSYDALNRDLINAIEEARALGVGVSSVGIAHDTDRFYGKENSLVVHKLDELSVQFIKMIRHKMIGGQGLVKRGRGKLARNKHLKF